MSEMLKVKVRLPTDRMVQGSYIIESVDRSDEGRYFCRATNSLGTAEAFVDVHMLGMSVCVITAARMYCDQPCLFVCGFVRSFRLLSTNQLIYSPSITTNSGGRTTRQLTALTVAHEKKTQVQCKIKLLQD